MDVKKMLAVGAAVIGTVAMADGIVSSSVVGYGPTETIDGGISAGASFVPVGASTVDLANITVQGYEGSTSVDIEVQTLDEFGATDKSYIWKDLTYFGTKYYGWYLDGELDGAYDDLDDDDKVTLQPGEGLWVLSSAEQDFTLQTAGEVASLDVPTTLIEGGLTCVNPTPVDVDLGDCYVDNYEGSTSVDVEVQTLDEFGATDKSYIWKDLTYFGTKYYGWYLDGELDCAYDDLDDDDKVTIKPGQGIWVLSSDEQEFQFVWPKVDL